MTSPISSSTEFHAPELQTNLGDLVAQNAHLDLAGGDADSPDSARSTPGQSAAESQAPNAGADTFTTAEPGDTTAETPVSGFAPLRSDAAVPSDEEGAGMMEKVRDALSGLPRNIGRTEQMIRLGAGTALVAAAVAAPASKGWKIGMAALGAIQIVTGATRYCPAWHALGINTNQPDEPQPRA